MTAIAHHTSSDTQNQDGYYTFDSEYSTSPYSKTSKNE